VAFYSAKDIPGVNSFMPKNYLFVCEPEVIFCDSRVLYFNQPVGIIVAKTFELAYSAAKYVLITYEKMGNFFLFSWIYIYCRINTFIFKRHDM
jgi:xanthine dehydrogenase molybdopterin-binding subunit B